MIAASIFNTPFGVPQAQYYQYAAYGEFRNASLLAGGPPATGGKKALLSPGVEAIAAELARDETAHVRAVSLENEETNSGTNFFVFHLKQDNRTSDRKQC